MNKLSLSSIPGGKLSWLNKATSFKVQKEDSLDITAGPLSDWFHNPSDSSVMNNAPVALFTPTGADFLFSAKLTVEFKSTFDAGVLFIYLNHGTWAKLCFEYSPQSEPMVVSVVTRGRSDDCNSVVIGGNTVYMRVGRQANALVYHYSTDGQTWHFVRHFTLGDLTNLRIGFAAQSPTGKGCTVHFTEIGFKYVKLLDLRSGA